MRRPFDGNYRISQPFGNKLYLKNDKGEIYDVYAQWNLAGHNGEDYALPNGTLVRSPFDGKVVERRRDDRSYGLYLKIENSKEGVVLAHLASFIAQLNQFVKEGEPIAYSDNTGLSTGAHLHVGYHPIPRDRNNGFNGYISFEEVLKKEELMATIDESKVRRDPLFYQKSELTFWDGLRTDAIKLIKEGQGHWVVNGLLRLVEREYLLNVESKKRRDQVDWEVAAMEKTKWPQPDSL